ncbi:MAG: ion transporter [Christensenella sp.]|uniref:ion transporter n=1 Tax=Christensenella sp. TaxID=1935934 RepID=UPI002B212DCF|nr:ion transporter [Christensenella sp.]MEA5003606.1 ion transporter [Christensenella sp.]
MKTDKAGKFPFWSRFYDIFIVVFILISIVPLFFNEDPPILQFFNFYVGVVFVADYLLNWLTADFHLKKGWKSFLIYPVTPWAIIDLLAILPLFGGVSDMLVLFRIFRLFRLFRIFKGLKYSTNFDLFITSLKKQKSTLLTLLFLTFAYTIISALIIYNVEIEAFPTFLDALSWSASSLANISFGDSFVIYTAAGKIIAILSSFIGIALIALPSGVITASFMTELHRFQLQEKREEREEREREKAEQAAENATKKE